MMFMNRIDLEGVGGYREGGEKVIERSELLEFFSLFYFLFKHLSLISF